MKAHATNSDSDNASIASKTFEEKYANQVQLSDTYHVEYDHDNLQGQLIMNNGSIGIDAKIIDNTQSK